LDQRGGVYAAIVTAEDVRQGVLADFEAVVFPGGSASKQGEALGEAGREAVVAFVRSGGGYLGICAGAYLGCSSMRPEGSVGRLGLVNAKTKSTKWQRGRGRVDLELTDAGRSILGG